MTTAKVFFHSNILFLRKRAKLTQDQLAEMLHFERNKFQALESGRTKNPVAVDLIGFSDFFKISIDNLLKIDLSKIGELKLRQLEAGNDAYATGTHIRVLATTVTPGNQDNIEMVPVKARAGYAAGYGDPEYIASLPVFHMPQLPQDRKYRMFPTIGDSMLPIPENAYIIGEYLENWTSIKSGTACIVITKHEGIVFKVVHNHLDDNRTLVLESLNSAYEPYAVTAANILEIWLFRSFISEHIPEKDYSVLQWGKTIEEISRNVKMVLQQMKS